MLFNKKALEFAQQAAAAEQKAALLYAQVQALQTTVDWMRVRVNQLEHERAKLIENYMGVKISVPQIEASESREGKTVSDILGAAINFNDMGDAEARREGIGWNEAGEVVKLEQVK